MKPFIEKSQMCMPAGGHFGHDAIGEAAMGEHEQHILALRR